MKSLSWLAVLGVSCLLLGEIPSIALPSENPADQAKLSKLFEQGNTALADGKYKKAVSAFSKALDQSDGALRIKALVGLTVAHKNLSQFEEALRYGEEVLTESKTPHDQARAENLIGTILFEDYQVSGHDVERSAELLARAEAYFRRALEISNGELEVAWLNLAGALESQGKLVEAKAALEEYLERDPENRSARGIHCWLEYSTASALEAGADSEESPSGKENTAVPAEPAVPTGSHQTAKATRVDALSTDEPSPVKIGGDVLPPKKLHSPQPPYTAAAREKGIQGVVIIEGVVDQRGNVSGVKVLKGLPDGLTEQAVRTVCEWQFEPATRNGTPVAVYLNVTARFSLDRKRSN